MDDPFSLLTWWQNERTKEVDRLRRNALAEPLSEVEMMILNPISIDQARNQVKMLNESKIVDLTRSDGEKL